MIKKFSTLHNAFTQDEQFLTAIERKDTRSLSAIVKSQAMSKGFNKDIVYHGTVFNFQNYTFKGNLQFFSPSEKFARSYAEQKSFEMQMDADIRVKSFYLYGKIFDPSSKEDIGKVFPYLPEEIYSGGTWGGQDITKEEWLEEISGIGIESPKFSDEDLKGKKPGDPLPDNEVGSKPLSYELIGFENNYVLYARRGTIVSIFPNNRSMPSFYVERVEKEFKEKGYTKQTVIEDLKKLEREKRNGNSSSNWFRKKYMLFVNDRYTEPSIYRTSRYPVQSSFDTWGSLEMDENLLEAFKKAGFKIIKMTEKGQTTYATLFNNIIKSSELVTYDNEKNIIPISKRFNLGTKDFRY